MEYFKTEADKITFALLECRGDFKKEMLGITSFWYKNEAYREKQKEEIKNKIKGHNKEKEALEQLNKMF